MKDEVFFGFGHRLNRDASKPSEIASCEEAKTMTNQDETLPGPQPASALPAEARMPLAARRLVLIAAGCILVGILAGRFLFAGLILAAAGITVLAVALSYRAGARWFSPLSGVVSAAGGLWTAATAGYYWLSLSAATGASKEAPAIVPALFSIGVGSFIIMAGGVMAAAVLRTVRRRTSSPLGKATDGIQARLDR